MLWATNVPSEVCKTESKVLYLYAVIRASRSVAPASGRVPWIARFTVADTADRLTETFRNNNIMNRL